MESEQKFTLMTGCVNTTITLTKMYSNQSIYAFLVTNGTVHLKVLENGRVDVITHLSHLRELFQENQLP